MRVQLMRFIGIIVVALVLIGLISLVLLNPLFPDPSTACSKVPPPLTTANNNHSAIQILSPGNGGHVVAIYQLPIFIKIQNFDLKQNGNKVAVWVDGIPIEAHASQDSVFIDGGALGNAHISLSDSTHDICLALIDGQSGKEVGDRVGVHFSWAWRGPDQPDFTWVTNLCFIVTLVSAKWIG